MDETPTIELDGHIVAFRRPLHMCSKFFFYTLALWWVMRPKFIFEKINGGGINLCVHNVQDFIKSSKLETSPFQLSLAMPPLLLGIIFFATT